MSMFRKHSMKSLMLNKEEKSTSNFSQDRQGCVIFSQEVMFKHDGFKQKD